MVGSEEVGLVVRQWAVREGAGKIWWIYFRGKSMGNKEEGPLGCIVVQY